MVYWFDGERKSCSTYEKPVPLPCLNVLKRKDLDMGEADLSGLLENLKFTPDLESLYLKGNPQGHAVRSMIPYLLEQQKLGRSLFSARRLFRRRFEVCSGSRQRKTTSAKN